MLLLLLLRRCVQLLLLLLLLLLLPLLLLSHAPLCLSPLLPELLACPFLAFSPAAAVTQSVSVRRAQSMQQCMSLFAVPASYAQHH